MLGSVVIGVGVVFVVAGAMPETATIGLLVITIIGLVLLWSSMLGRQRVRIYVDSLEPARRPFLPAITGKRFTVRREEIFRSRILPSSYGRDYDSMLVQTRGGSVSDLNSVFISPEATRQLRMYVEGLGVQTITDADVAVFWRRAASEVIRRIASGSVIVWLLSAAAFATFVARGVLDTSSGAYLSLVLAGASGVWVLAWYFLRRPSQREEES